MDELSRSSANDSTKYRVGIFGRTGKGNYGHSVDTAWRNIPETEVVAVCDENKSGRPQTARKLGVSETYADYREMLEQADLDIIAICPRWVDQHRDVSVAAAEHGVHIYMEKPFCRSPAEADEIITACERRHVKLAIAHPTSYSPRISTLKKLLKDGAIGDVVEYQMRGKEDRRGGAEDLWVLGTHLLDMILTLGEEPERCNATLLKDRQPVTSADVVDGNEGLGPMAGNALIAEYRLQRGIPATFRSYQNAGGNPSRYGLRILGTRGVVEVYEGTLAPMYLLQDSSWSTARTTSKWQEVSSAGPGIPEPLSGPRYTLRHQLAIEDLLSAIKEDRLPISNMYQGRQIVEMICATFQSHITGAPVTFPLAKRENAFSKPL